MWTDVLNLERVKLFSYLILSKKGVELRMNINGNGGNCKIVTLQIEFDR